MALLWDGAACCRQAEPPAPQCQAWHKHRGETRQLQRKAVWRSWRKSVAEVLLACPVPPTQQTRCFTKKLLRPLAGKHHSRCKSGKNMPGFLNGYSFWDQEYLTMRIAEGNFRTSSRARAVVPKLHFFTPWDLKFRGAVSAALQLTWI